MTNPSMKRSMSIIDYKDGTRGQIIWDCCVATGEEQGNPEFDGDEEAFQDDDSMNESNLEETEG